MGRITYVNSFHNPEIPGSNLIHSGTIVKTCGYWQLVKHRTSSGMRKGSALIFETVRKGVCISQTNGPTNFADTIKKLSTG
jgi:hypothetical protein